jgi:hypothetical protein
LPGGILDSDAIEGAAEPPYGLLDIQVDGIRKDPRDYRPALLKD